jgi:hypothetical protein
MLKIVWDSTLTRGSGAKNDGRAKWLIQLAQREAEGKIDNMCSYTVSCGHRQILLIQCRDSKDSFWSLAISCRKGNVEPLSEGMKEEQGSILASDGLSSLVNGVSISMPANLSVELVLS